MAATTRNASAPDRPTPSSPLRGNGIGTALVGWFTTIIDFIASMSPDGASVHDTGWVPVTVNSGFAQQGTSAPMVRRVGKTVHYRWGFAATGISAGNAFTVGSIPSGFRPAQDVYTYAASNSVGSAGRFRFATGGDIVLTTHTQVGTYYVINASWMVD